MGDPTHLEKMGRELKCPICLSLLSSAVSLPCNHAFCNACIVKSMKSVSNCPVCKVPYRRREVRAAPHMDNLVNIYKSMEVASGFNIFVTQNAPSSKLSDEKKRVESDTNSWKDDIGKVCHDRLEYQRRSKHRGPREATTSILENPGAITEKPSFPTKKRVQVPQYPISKSSMQSQKLGTGIDENVKDGSTNSLVAITKENSVFSEKGQHMLSPFFWLRDEDVDKSSQCADGDEFLEITPPNVPTFSDMKDSQDEDPSKSSPSGVVCDKSNVADPFDGEMFEWTQRACSPELISSPVKMQAGTIDEIDGLEESKSAAPSVSANINETPGNEKENGMGNSGEVKPGVQSLKTKRANYQVGDSKSNKRGAKAREAAPKKREKRNADKNLQDHSNTEPGKSMQQDAFENKGSSLNLEKTRKRNKKVDFGNSGTESNPKIVSSVSVGQPLNLVEENMVVELSDSLEEKQDGKADLKMNRKVCRNVSRQSPQDCSLRTKKQKPDSTEVNRSEVYTTFKEMDECVDPQVSFLSVPVLHDKDISDIQVRPDEHGQELKSAMASERNKEFSSRKSMKVTFGGMSKKELTNGCQKVHSNVSAKEAQTMGMVINVSAKETESPEQLQGTLNTKILDNSVTVANLCQATGGALRKCKNPTYKIQCAFCLSSGDSEASGELVHFCNGRPVAADYNGGSKVIHSHRNCAEWAPNVYFEGDTAINLEAELARSRRIKCCCCGLKGAALGCYEKSCRKSFHVPCAKLMPQCQWDTDNYVMLCPLHVSSKLPNENSGSLTRKRKKYIPKGQSSSQCNQVVLKSNISKSQKWKSSETTDMFVLCCSGLTTEEREMVSEFERLSGLAVLKNWDLTVTHIIASTDENGACKRTLKILMAILEGKWILNIEWVKACIKAMKLVAEDQYEVNIDIHGIRDGPRLGRLRVLHKRPKIFEGLKFYFLGDFVQSYKGYVQDLIISGGGTVLHRKPIFGATAPSTFIIYSLELPEKCNPSKKEMIFNRRRSDAETLANSTLGKAVSNLWILNSIAACNLQSFGE